MPKSRLASLQRLYPEKSTTLSACEEGIPSRSSWRSLRQVVFWRRDLLAEPVPARSTREPSLKPLKALLDKVLTFYSQEERERLLLNRRRPSPLESPYEANQSKDK